VFFPDKHSDFFGRFSPVLTTWQQNRKVEKENDSVKSLSVGNLDSKHDEFYFWVVVSNIFYFHPLFGEDSHF